MVRIALLTCLSADRSLNIYQALEKKRPLTGYKNNVMKKHYFYSYRYLQSSLYQTINSPS